MMTEDELAAIEARWGRVEWRLRQNRYEAWLEGRPIPYEPMYLEEDRAFLSLAAAAPADIQALITEVRRLRK